MSQYVKRRKDAVKPPITQDDVFFLLEPLVGLPLLLAHSELSSDIAALLSEYDWTGGEPPDALCSRVESALFNGIYSYTGGKMSVADVRGKRRKVYTDALSQMAETLMGPVFDRLPICRAAYDLLSGYAARHLSLPALRRLCTGFSDILEPANRALFARIVKENFPKEAYQDWLAE